MDQRALYTSLLDTAPAPALIIIITVLCRGEFPLRWTPSNCRHSTRGLSVSVHVLTGCQDFFFRKRDPLSMRCGWLCSILLKLHYIIIIIRYNNCRCRPAVKCVPTIHNNIMYAYYRKNDIILCYREIIIIITMFIGHR